VTPAGSPLRERDKKATLFSPVSLNGINQSLPHPLQYGPNEFSRQYDYYGLYSLYKYGRSADLFEYVVDVDGFDVDCGVIIIRDRQCELLDGGYVDN